ncbi:acyl-CoA dehydrogenase [Acidianus sp. HS-5]|uniref:acyl-CoA dehydrogenase family protein n=1 Tax=Acidianus sp. HS-5 TaxID=2886040 RepID=UPI001F1C3329|nr:acyl-CoA dehydrogenase [Acidianus sp. HS-5]BDC17612.1 acyl-CoA dehydrogenase [Acidianus sp. HS-5]
MSEIDLITKSLREFLKREVEGIAGKIDKEDFYPRNTVMQLGELGYLIPIYSNLSHYDMFTTLEEIAKVSGSLALIADAQGELAGEMIRLYGNESQKKEFLEPMSKGEIIGSFALTEPSGGSDIGSMSTRAEKKGSWIVNGHKMWITQGLYADVFVTVAKTGNSRTDLSVFIVPRSNCVETHKIEVMGNRGTGTAEVIFHECEVTEENVVGEVNNGWKMVNSVLEVGRLAISGIAIGLAERALEEAFSWANSRTAFGNKLYSFQGLRWYFADSIAKINSIKALTKEVSRKFDENSKDKGVFVSMLKLLSANIAQEVIDSSLQIFGGLGYAKGTVVERIFRDIRLMRIGEGSDEVQRHIISKYSEKYGIPILD